MSFTRNEGGGAKKDKIEAIMFVFYHEHLKIEDQKIKKALQKRVASLRA